MSDVRAQIIDHLSKMVGVPVWSAIAGPRGDYVLSLELGGKIRRSMRLANPKLSFLQRTYEGEYGLLVECPWRLDGPHGVVTSCLGLIGRKDPPLSDELGEIEDSVIEAIDVIPPAWDLTVHLSGGYVLRCLSAEVDVARIRNNWSFWSPEGPLTIGPRGRVLEAAGGNVDPIRKRMLEILESGDEDD